MKRVVILALVLLTLSANLADARATKNIDGMTIYFDDYTIEGKGLQISMRVNLNLSYMQLTFYRGLNSFVAFSNKFETFVPGDYLEVDVDPQDLTAGEYQVRLVAKQHDLGNITLPVVSTFFTIRVERVLHDYEIVVAIIAMSSVIMLPIFYDRDKSRLEIKSWNVISFRKYVGIRLGFLKRRKFWFIITMLATLTAGGFYYIPKL